MDAGEYCTPGNALVHVAEVAHVVEEHERALAVAYREVAEAIEETVADQTLAVVAEVAGVS